MSDTSAQWDARAFGFDGTRKMNWNLLDLMSVQRGHFRYESGHYARSGSISIGLFLNPIRISPLAHDLASRLAPSAIESVVGPLVGGASLAQTTVELGVQFAYTALAMSIQSSQG
jgi:orotate phosphoribosyltransferase